MSEPIISHGAMVAELEREIAVRQRMYPLWIKSGRLKETKATYQLAVIQAVLREIKGPQQEALF